MLELETARMWPDECLLARCDLSHVSWILTANSVQGLPDTLLSRLAVVQVTSPSADAFEPLLRGILRDVAARYSIDVKRLPGLDPVIVGVLRRAFEDGASPRQLRAAVVRTLGIAARATPTH
jgi:ATP-dependent Lon protease